MLQKILRIANIGRFQKYNPVGDVEFKNLTTIYAENGRGKTTLSSIFRSLKDNEPLLILERTTLGGIYSPEIEIRMLTGNYLFKNGKWDKNDPNIEIFDSNFINKNVFSGECVEHDHKKNLYRFVVGEKGVSLALKVDSLDDEIKAKNNAINLKEIELRKIIIGSDLSIDDFLSLKCEPKIKELLEEKEKEIEVLRKSRLIVSRAPLQKVILPTFPSSKIDGILSKEVEGISKEAEVKTKDHVKSHLDNDGEQWLQKGLKYLDENCPFCGQNINEEELITAFKSYFDISYKQHKEDISEIGKHFTSEFSETALLHLQRIFDSNVALIEFWKEYITIGNGLPLSFEEVELIYRKLRDIATEKLRQKYQAPLDPITTIDNEYLDAIINYGLVNKLIDKYNLYIDEINVLIQKKKLEAGSGNISTAEKDLEKLKNISKRCESHTENICNGYKQLRNEKSDLDKEKRTAKNELNEFTETVFEKYQTGINTYLQKILAGFEVVEAKTGYSGGGPSSNYCIKINEVSVGLGDTKTFGKPCFRNILSQGDKNALAFAFFLARLDQDEQLKNKILIFDDPISSLDGYRQACTEQEITKLSLRSKQCIVMSHDKYFLRSVWNKGSAVKSLQIVRGADGSEIVGWDIVSDTRGGYFNDFYKMLRYKNKGGAKSDQELRDIARCLRPVLEGYLRIKFPDDFTEDFWLGEFLGVLDTSTDVKFEEFKKAHLGDLKDIKDYSNRYHHKENPTADSEMITDAELQGFLSRAFKIMNT